EAKIPGNLLDGANAVKLRGKLRFRRIKLQLLHTLETIASVRWNRSRIIIGAVAELRELDNAQGGQCPSIDVEIAGQRSGEIRDFPLLKQKADARRAPQLSEEFLPVIIRQLDRQLLRNQILLHQGNEDRAARFLLQSACRCDPVRCDV